jgi:ribosomal protein S18 acetylase RimI-like enzyme
VAVAPVEIVPLTDSDIYGAATVCARAFHDVELMTNVLPNPLEREKSASLMFDQGIRFASLVGVAFVPSGYPNGLLLGWRLPVGEPSLEQMMEAGLAPLHELIGEKPVAGFEHLVGHIEAHQTRLISPPCWYLAVLGVDPAYQGKGIGSALVREFQARADADGIPSCLCTTTPANVGFYESLGYRVVAEDIVPDSELRYWIFERAPA